MGMSAKEQLRHKLQEEANRFNRNFKIGDAVSYTNDDGKVYNTRVASPAFIDGGFRTVVHLDDVHRAINVCRVKTGEA